MSRPKVYVHDCSHRYRQYCHVITIALYHNNTKRYLEMLLDTGATYVSVPNDVFDALGLVTIQTVAMVTPSGKYEARIGIIENVIVDGRVSVSSVEVATTGQEMGRIGGLLGGSFLKEVGVYLEPRKGLLRFHYV